MHPLLQLTSWFCHHDPERSFNLLAEGEFCARCSGIYFGAVVLVFVIVTSQRTFGWPVRRLQGILLLVMALVTPAEVAAEAGAFPSSNHLRFLLGIVTGIGIVGLCSLRPIRSTDVPTSDITIIGTSVSVALFASLVLLPPVALLGSWLSSRVFVLTSHVGFVVFVTSLLSCAFRLISGILGTRTTDVGREVQS